MDIYASVLLVSGAASIISGFWVWLADRKNPLYQSWFGLNLTVAIFLIGLGLSFMTDDSESKAILVYQDIIYFGASTCAPFLFWFSAVLTDNFKKLKKLVWANFLAGIIFAALFLFTDIFVKSAYLPSEDWGWVFEPTDWYIVFVLWSVILMISSVIIIGRAMGSKKFSDLQRQLIKFSFWGILVTFSAAYLNFLIDYGVYIPPMINSLVPSCFIFTGYAMIKRRIMDAKFIFTEILIIGMGLILIIFSLTMPSRAFALGSWSIFAVYCFIGYLLIKTSFRELESKEILEREVKEKTASLQFAYDDIKKQKEELEKWYKLTIGRELRMAELKSKIKEAEETKNK